MPTRNLPDDPHLDHLRGQAKTLLKGVRAGESASARAGRGVPSRCRRLGGRAAGDRAQLRIRQLAASSCGISSWSTTTAVRRTGSPSAGRWILPSNGPTSSSGWRPCTTGRTIRPASSPRATFCSDYPEIAQSNIYTQVVAGDARRRPGERWPRPAQHRRRTVPLGTACSTSPTNRLDAPNQFEIARLLLENGADPNAGYLWQGLPSPFTALTGAFGRGEGDQPPHHEPRWSWPGSCSKPAPTPNDSQTMYNCGPGCPPPYDDDASGTAAGVRSGQGRRRSVARADDHRPSDAAATPGGRTRLRRVPAGLLHRVELVLAQGTDPEGVGTRHPVFAGHRAYELAAVQGLHRDRGTAPRTAGAAPLDEIHEVYAAAMRGEPVDATSGAGRTRGRRNPHLPLARPSSGGRKRWNRCRDSGSI